MVHDAVWESVASDAHYLCVGCLEDRLDRTLEPDDFPPIPINDDEATDSVRLRLRKGSGRSTYALYELATAAVVKLGAEVEVAARALEIDPGLLGVWVDHARLVAEVS